MQAHMFEDRQPPPYILLLLVNGKVTRISQVSPAAAIWVNQQKISHITERRITPWAVTY
jgi:hypothetical protein